MRSHRRLIAAIAAAGLGAVGLAVTQSAEAAEERPCNQIQGSVDRVLECVTLEGVLEHEQAFQDIADANNGTRASGTSGFDASLDYVEERMKGAGYRVTRQPFEFHAFAEVGDSELEQTAPGQVTYVEGTDFSVTSQSEPGDVTALVTPVDLDLGLGNTSSSGCEEEDWADFPEGNIALLQRGFCTFEVKGELAAAHGASGILFFNQGDVDNAGRMGIPAVTLSNDYTGGIPALNLTYALGEQLAGIEGLEMRLFANVTRVLSITENLIADSKGGDPDNLVMAGAHLDSVNEGPGINDNGSGSSALLEVAEALAKAKPVNKLRFAWWSAEEASLVGSTFYVGQLSDEQIAQHEMYLNFDMVGSPNYGFFILDGDGSGFGLEGPDGSDDIEALFERYYAERGVPSEPAAFTGRSDYQAFINNGIPSGGLFTGADGIKTAAQVLKWGGVVNEQYDQCYHQACDTIDNINHTALRVNADAMGYVIYLYASGQETITVGMN